MFFSSDMKDLINLFEKHDVQYVLVGGFAVNYYGYVRTTIDIDLLLFPSEENAIKVMSALSEFGFGHAGIPISLFEEPGSAVHLGVEPNRVDLLTHLVGISNEQIFSNCKRIRIDEISLNIISVKDLIEAKKKSKRLRDLADAEELEKSIDKQKLG